MQQEPVLFSGTVYENVAFGLAGTDKASLPAAKQRALVEKACQIAYAQEFIERLPKVSHPSPHSRNKLLSFSLTEYGADFY